jgi:hypothetical protein
MAFFLGAMYMKSSTFDEAVPFIDRRNGSTSQGPAGRERRQFSNNYDSLSDEARALALAIDQYKLDHRRRFITYEEMLTIMKQLGYSKYETATSSL